MNFNVYIDKRTGERLRRLAKRRRTTRTALVREALAQLLSRDGKAGWPKAVLDFQGVPETPRFEDARSMLKTPRANWCS